MTSKWSIASEDSVLSIASRGSALSIASVGSFLSIGSIGSVTSVLGIGSASSAASVLSAASCGSVMSAASLGSIMSAGSKGAEMSTEDGRRDATLRTAVQGALIAALTTLALRRLLRDRPAESLDLVANHALAEDAGFEPARGFIPNTISNRAH